MKLYGQAFLKREGLDKRYIDDVTYLTNRASDVFNAALIPLGAEPYWRGKPHINVSYFNTYGGKRPPAITADISLMDRKKTVPLDNKAHLAKRLIQHGRCRPMVYFHPDDVPEGNQLWYIKDPLGSAGRSIVVAKKQEAHQHFKQGYILQEAVQDILLIEKRKATLRSYVLVHDNNVYLYPEGFFVIHGKEYDPKSQELGIQVDHSGYLDSSSSVRLKPASQLSAYENIYEHLKHMVANLFPLFADLLIDTKDRYCIFGLDFLCHNDSTLSLIEINDRPNFLHTTTINEQVNVEMIRDTVMILLEKEDYPNRFDSVGSLSQ